MKMRLATSGTRFLTLAFAVWLVCYVSALGDSAGQAAKDAAIVETLLRLPNIDVNKNEKMKAAVTRYLESRKGTERYLELVEKFNLKDTGQELLRLIGEDPSSSLAVRAAGLLLKSDENVAFLQKAIHSNDEEASVGVVTSLGLVGNNRVVEMLIPLVTDVKRPIALRTAAAQGLGRNRNGELYLLELVQTSKLPKELKFVVGDILHSSANETTRTEVAKYIELPATAAGEPLPTIAQLLQKAGDALHGKKVYETNGTCAKCHIVHKQGKEVGPNLSEIGSKLSKEAMYVSILDPNAGISHNYENYSILLDDGTAITGVKISETDDSITLRTAEAIDRTIERSAIDEFKKQPTSLMPSNLQKVMTVQDLVDVVEFLTTLKKPN